MSDFQQTNKQIHYFPLLSNSERLDYELLTVENSQTLVELFEQDTSPYVDSRFKNKKKAEYYATEWQCKTETLSTEDGSCNFLIKLKNTETYIGVLYLFDLRTQTFADNHLRATIGFAIAAPFRKQRYATETVKHLIDYVQNVLKKPNILAYTHPKNEAANHFLLSLGMTLNSEDYDFGYNSYELKG